MALSVCGLVDEAVDAYRWLVRRQLPDGAWFNYYQGDGVKDPRLDTNVCAYLAAGAWHHHLITGDVELLGELWPTIEGGIDFILRFQQPDGSVLWSLDSAGRPEAYALLDRILVDLPLASLRRGDRRVPGQGPPRLGAGGGPPRARRGPPPRRLRPEGRVRHGLVLPDALGCARGRGGAPSHRRGLVDLRHGGPRRALRVDGRLGHRRRDGRVRADPRRPRHGRAGARPVRGRPGPAPARRVVLDRDGLPRGGDLPEARAHHLHLRRHGAGRRRACRTRRLRPGCSAARACRLRSTWPSPTAATPPRAAPSRTPHRR